MAGPMYERGSREREIARARLRNMGMLIPDSLVEQGRAWYGNVHDVTSRQSRDRGFSTRQGAGIVAAVSPNMDFNARNIAALDEIHNLDDSDWEMIRRSAQRGGVDSSNNTKKRLPEVREMLREKAPSLGGGYDAGLVKAHRIMTGEDPNDVLARRGAPKTNAFFHNILNPHQMGPVTVDGRHSDLINNTRLPWDVGRGISSADLKRGTSRYENMEDLTRSVTSSLSGRHGRAMYGGLLPHELQAVLWVAGRAIERGGRADFDPETGSARRGAKRQGQQYVNKRGEPMGFSWSESEFR